MCSTHWTDKGRHASCGLLQRLQEARMRPLVYFGKPYGCCGASRIIQTGGGRMNFPELQSTDLLLSLPPVSLQCKEAPAYFGFGF